MGLDWLALYFPTCLSHIEIRQRSAAPSLNKQTRVVLTGNLQEFKYNPPHHEQVAQHSALIHFPELQHLMKTDLFESIFSEWGLEAPSTWRNMGQGLQTNTLLQIWATVFQPLWGLIFVASYQVIKEHFLKNNSIR